MFILKSQKQLSPHKNVVEFIGSTVIKADSKQAFQSEADEVYILMEYCSGKFLSIFLFGHPSGAASCVFVLYIPCRYRGYANMVLYSQRSGTFAAAGEDGRAKEAFPTGSNS